MKKKINIRSLFFVIVGVLLILTLVICIYILNGEKDLVKVRATVTKVNVDNSSNGKNDITVSYEVDDNRYLCSFVYRDEVKVGDTIVVYYHENNITSIQDSKTGYYIFISPLLGVCMCFVGLIGLFKEDDDEDENVSLIGDASDEKIEVVDSTDEVAEIVESSSEVAEIVDEVKELKEENVEERIELPKLDSSDSIEKDVALASLATESIIEDKQEETSIVEEVNEGSQDKPKEKYVLDSYKVVKEKLEYVVNGEKKLLDIKEIVKVIRFIGNNNEVDRAIIETNDSILELNKKPDIRLGKTTNILCNKLNNLGVLYTCETK